MKFFLPCLAIILAASAVQGADDPSIDKLLSKLPPPEKLVDPAINDPLIKQMITAAKARNFGIALEDYLQLARRYPKSLGAQSLHAQIALALHLYPESSAAYQKALSIRPDFVDGLFGLGMAELSQRHFHAAMGDFQQVTRLVPNKDLGWVALSVCAEKSGDKKDSLNYARKGTAMAPNSWVAWKQAAREESLAGNKQAAVSDVARAVQLLKVRPKPAKKS